MLFNSSLFLFFFLPVSLALHWFAFPFLRNTILVILSLIFYWWGAGSMTLLLISSVIINWLFGLMIGFGRSSGVKKLSLAAAIVLNLGALVYLKYFVLAATTMAFALSQDSSHFLPWGQIVLPIGISFYTFHAISYVVDIYRESKKPFVNPIDYAVYLTFFPLLIAGPIVRFHDIADQIAHRVFDVDRFAQGCERFCYGLAKKVLLADSLAKVVDHIFATDPTQLSAGHAWLGVLCFALQIYFDFSGYSDMAIGLSKMLGFELLENFNYPFLATSITDFWHRWHLSLSTWFRDYLYIPLGGNRVSELATYRNLIIVFVLCGFWHGANWTFLCWGLYHGLFLILERKAHPGNYLPIIFCRVGTLAVILLSWVLFRVKTLPDALHYYASLLGFHMLAPRGDDLGLLLNLKFAVILSLSIVIALGAFGFVSSDFHTRRFPSKATRNLVLLPWLQNVLERHAVLCQGVRYSLCLILLFLSISEIALSTSQSFIYFKF